MTASFPRSQFHSDDHAEDQPYGPLRHQSTHHSFMSLAKQHGLQDVSTSKTQPVNNTSPCSGRNPIQQRHRRVLIPTLNLRLPSSLWTFQSFDFLATLNHHRP